MTDPTALDRAVTVANRIHGSADGWRTTRWHVQDSPIGGPCITASPADPLAADADVIVDLVRSTEIAEHIVDNHNASLAATPDSLTEKVARIVARAVQGDYVDALIDTEPTTDPARVRLTVFDYDNNDRVSTFLLTITPAP